MVYFENVRLVGFVNIVDDSNHCGPLCQLVCVLTHIPFYYTPPEHALFAYIACAKQ